MVIINIFSYNSLKNNKLKYFNINKDENESNYSMRWNGNSFARRN